MNRVVYKFPVESGGGFGPALMPVGAEILHADTLAGDVYVWALVDTDAPSTVTRHLGFFGTGHKEIPVAARHIGTCIDRAYDLVWHVFELPEGGGSGAGETDVSERSAVSDEHAGAASTATGTTRLHGVHHFERLRRTFGFDYWDEPAIGSEAA